MASLEMFFADISFTFLTLLPHLSSGEAQLVPAPVFVDQLQLKELQVPGRRGHSNHLGIVPSAYLPWSVALQVHKRNRN